MAEDKNRFQVGASLDTPVTLLMWQLLDQSPQLMVKLARAIASSRNTKRRKKSARPNPVRTAAAASKFRTPTVIETVAHDDKEVICLYIDFWIEEQKISKTLVDSDVVVELISRKVVQDLNLPVYPNGRKMDLTVGEWLAGRSTKVCSGYNKRFRGTSPSQNINLRRGTSLWSFFIQKTDV